MQVRPKDSKHLFSLDNLLDFLHKKADVTDCVKHRRFQWRIHDTFIHESFVMKMKWGRKNTRGGGTDTETKTEETKKKKIKEEGDTW